ncbi:MAG: hypothetical protein ABIX28_04090 [Vicinamibacterales bacterium]
MIRILRAFTWMRWRVFLNSLERTGARDTLERLSLAVDQLGPIIAALLLVPSLIGMSGLSGYAGYALATSPSGALTFQILRFLAVAATAMSVVGPILLPGRDSTNPVRLLLLPIPRATLYVAQAAGALAEPWTLVLLPIAICLPVGLAVGGNVAAAAIAVVAAVTFIIVLLGLSTLTSSVVQIVLRDRRRGEMIALAFVLLLPLVGMLTSSFDPGRSRRRDHAQPTPVTAPSVASRVGTRVFAASPSERFIAATRAAVAGQTSASLSAWLVLAATAGLLHGAAFLAFSRILAFPGSVTRRRTSGRQAAPGWRLPWLSAGANAVATAQIRLTMRTPRGRSTLLSPLMVCVAFAVIGSRGSGQVPFIPTSGLSFALLGVLASILTALPLVTNQFAIDGAGLTLELLSPLSDDDLLTGKAVGNALLSAVPALLIMSAALLLYPGGDLALWICIPLGMAAVWLLVAPAAAVLSALFPKVVDLNSIGNRSNAHGVANLAGMAITAVSTLPPIGLGLLATRVLDRPGLAPLLLIGWVVVAFGVNRLAARPVRALLARRRENLALVVG